MNLHTWWACEHLEKPERGFDFSPKGVRDWVRKQRNYRLFSNETIFMQRSLVIFTR